MSKKQNTLNEQDSDLLEQTKQSFSKALWFIFLFSFATNLLQLALPLYTLQVMDRVMGSQSLATLFWLTVLVLALFAIYGAFSAVRSLALVRMGEWLEHRLGELFLKKSVAQAAVQPNASGAQNLRDLAAVKGFVTGAGINSFFDAPWSLVYIGIIFIIHPVLGFICIGGALLLIFFAFLNEYAVRKPISEANEQSVKMMNQVEISARNAEVIEAMGMMESIAAQWRKRNQHVIDHQSVASNRAAIIMSIAKSFRMTLQILIMGSGTYLVLQHQVTAGGVIAASIIAGRALAPFEAAIGMWNPFKSAVKSYQRLKQSLANSPYRQKTMELPAPSGQITGEKVLYAPPGSMKTVIKGINFEIQAGDVVGIVGPSAAGKSTLAKLIAGVWKPSSGAVRLDGADVYTWNREDFGKYMGYVPQGVELFDGTVRDNIARFREGASDTDVVAAAQMANVHDLILSLQNGYETQIGAGGSNLSAGQRQRIALARAFFGNPRVLVLDEPNSNLDEVGEAALSGAIQNAKKMKMTTIVVSHRPSLLTHVDKIMVMKDGLIVDFGPAKEVLMKYAGNAVAGKAAAKQVTAQAAQPAAPKASEGGAPEGTAGTAGA